MEWDTTLRMKILSKLTKMRQRMEPHHDPIDPCREHGEEPQ
jgi:hypothetical protein